MKNRFKVKVTLIAIIQSLLAAYERFVIRAIGIAKRLHSFTLGALWIALLSTASHTLCIYSTTEFRTIIYGVEDFFDTSNGPGRTHLKWTPSSFRGCGSREPR